MPRVWITWSLCISRNREACFLSFTVNHVHHSGQPLLIPSSQISPCTSHYHETFCKSPSHCSSSVPELRTSREGGPSPPLTLRDLRVLRPNMLGHYDKLETLEFKWVYWLWNQRHVVSPFHTKDAGFNACELDCRRFTCHYST